MKRILLGVLTLWLMGAGVAQGQPKTVRLYIAPDSTVAFRHHKKSGLQVPGHHDTTSDPQSQDYMLQAWGWSGNYKFTVFQPRGTAVYGSP